MVSRKGDKYNFRKKKPTVEVLWDAIPELNIEQHRTIEILPASKWNKDTEGAWRMDIDISDKESDK